MWLVLGPRPSWGAWSGRLTSFFRYVPPCSARNQVNFRGSELQNYFTKILEDNLKAIIKPQYVDHIPKVPRRPGPF